MGDSASVSNDLKGAKREWKNRARQARNSVPWSLIQYSLARVSFGSAVAKQCIKTVQRSKDKKASSWCIARIKLNCGCTWQERLDLELHHHGGATVSSKRWTVWA